jgi:hypothetical protein
MVCRSSSNSHSGQLNPAMVARRDTGVIRKVEATILRSLLMVSMEVPVTIQVHIPSNTTIEGLEACWVAWVAWEEATEGATEEVEATEAY